MDRLKTFKANLKKTYIKYSNKFALYRRFVLLISEIFIVLATIFILAFTQISTTSYYKDGVLKGVMSEAYESTKIIYFIFTWFIGALVIFTSYYLFKARNEFGIHNKKLMQMLRVLIAVGPIIIVLAILNHSLGSLQATSILSWIVFALSVWVAITMGSFLYQVYLT